jgi:hypothetical protein
MEITGPRIYQAVAVKLGLKAIKIGLKLNAAYTKTNLLKTATRFTEQKYSTRGTADIDRAITDITVWIDDARDILAEEALKDA